ncbi:hypothetical protein M0802_005933 [Mischocyttarus mexicanus]|nr:hypothetical protein M0802_005933 [Mischocyttarus mexicanus]
MNNSQHKILYYSLKEETFNKVGEYQGTVKLSKHTSSIQVDVRDGCTDKEALHKLVTPTMRVLAPPLAAIAAAHMEFIRIRNLMLHVRLSVVY